MKPDYIGIGAGRCGTTSLHVALLHHSNVAELGQKEIHFWDNKYGRRSVQWYFSLFSKVPGQVTGEITPSYFYVPYVPERIAKHCPNAKFLVLLRNPVDAMGSAYWRMRRRRQTRASILDFLEREGKFARLRNIYYYANHLTRWFAVFPKEQFWIAQSEKLFGGKELTSLWRFLGVSVMRGIQFPWKERQAHKKTEARKKLVRFFKPLNEELFALLGKRYDWK